MGATQTQGEHRREGVLREVFFRLGDLRTV
jgi:hypothetical protein